MIHVRSVSGFITSVKMCSHHTGWCKLRLTVVRVFPQSMAPCCLVALLLLWWETKNNSTIKTQDNIFSIFTLTPHLSSFCLLWSACFFVSTTTCKEKRPLSSLQRLLLHRKYGTQLLLLLLLLLLILLLLLLLDLVFFPQNFSELSSLYLVDIKICPFR